MWRRITCYLIFKIIYCFGFCQTKPLPINTDDAIHWLEPTKETEIYSYLVFGRFYNTWNTTWDMRQCISFFIICIIASGSPTTAPNLKEVFFRCENLLIFFQNLFTSFASTTAVLLNFYLDISGFSIIAAFG